MSELGALKGTEVVKKMGKKRFNKENIGRGQVRMTLRNDDGKLTSIRVRVYNSTRTASDNVLLRYSRQARLTLGKYKDYLQCKYDYSAYLEDLKNSNIIRD